MAKLTLDVDRILRPIAGGGLVPDDGAGRYYGYDYGAIEEARRVVEAPTLLGDEDDKYRSLYSLKAQAADWSEVVKLCTEALARESKDLQVCAWLVEALGQLRGFNGLRDGFDLLRRLQEAFWDSAWPKIEDGDTYDRRFPYEFLNAPESLPLVIQSVPLTGDQTGMRLSLLRYHEALESDKLARNPFDSEAEREKWIQERSEKYKKIFVKQWEEAVSFTDTSFYEGIADEVQECYLAFKKWERSTDSLFGKGSPSLIDVEKAFDEIVKLLQGVLEERESPKAKRLGDAVKRARAGQFEPPESVPADEVEDSDESDESVDEIEDSNDPDENGDATRSEVQWPTTAKVRASRASDPGKASSSLTDADEAYRRILESAAFLRGADPDDPVPYLLVRALRAGELFRDRDVELAGPSGETRKTLARLSAEGEWRNLIEEAENALGGPEGRGWLDGHRLALRGLEEEGRSAAWNACKRFLLMVVDAFPDLAERELDDGTPAANPETSRWLAENRDERPGRDDQDDPAREVATPDDAPTDSIDEDGAVDEVEDLGLEEAIRRLNARVSSATHDRDRFLRRLRLAELCVQEWRTSLALPMLDALTAEIKERRLEAWEGGDFCARVARARFICLDRRKRDVPEESLNEAYALLARLDPAAALGYQWDEDA
ncbi:MAG: type VI secretion system protein TssA [Isosphaeraceae bacterium]